MKWKAIIGIVLAIASVAALYLWETKFEDEITLTPVIVLSESHSAGDIIDSSNLKILKINPEAKLDNALSASQSDVIVGKVLNRDLLQNQQLIADYFVSKDEVLPEGYVNFVIPSDWIYSKSVLIKQRDMAEIYAMPQKLYLGTYKIDQLYDGTIEIIAKLEDYFKIYDSVNSIHSNSEDETYSNNQLLFVMKEDL
ncbi:MAG: SAF domain-containing protein [Bacillota bacterium]|nr:SAF domain-containing protein [Bacillota bacterium]